MNQYGRQTQRYWQQNLPRQYAQIPDPTGYFTRLGEDLAQQIQDLTDTIAGPDRQDEGYLGKLGRLNEARTAAEDQVMRETLPEPEEPAVTA